MISSAWIKPLAIAALLSACFAAGWTAQGWRKDGVILEMQKAQALSFAEHQKKSQDEYERMEKEKNDAIKQAQAETEKYRSDADRARADAGRLRRDIAGVPARIAAATRAAVDEYAATAGELLGACTEEYQWMAEQADRHAVNERLVLNAWPKKNPP